MTKKTWLLIALAALACMALALGIPALTEYAARPKPGETRAPEESIAVDGVVITYHATLSTETYPTGTPTGDWIVGCADSDRNDYFDAYVLRHDETVGEMTTYTYLLYIPGVTSDTAAPTLIEGETYGYRIDLSRTAPTEGGYTLSRVAVTLPTVEEAPRLRVLVDDDALGTLVTVTDSPIPTGE